MIEIAEKEKEIEERKANSENQSKGYNEDENVLDDSNAE
jgi:hypothetical protein